MTAATAPSNATIAEDSLKEIKGLVTDLLLKDTERPATDALYLLHNADADDSAMLVKAHGLLVTAVTEGIEDNGFADERLIEILSHVYQMLFNDFPLEFTGGRWIVDRHRIPA